MTSKLIQTALGEVSSTELTKLCDKSRLPQYYKILIRNEKMEPLNRLSQYKKEYVKAQFGSRGRNSGLHPGVVYPRKEELNHLKQFERAFYPPLQQLIDENVEKKKAELQKRVDWENTVLENLSKLEAAKKEFFDKIKEKKLQQKAWLEKREQQIEDVRGTVKPAKSQEKKR